MKSTLLTFSILILGGSLLAQESPMTPRAAKVQISEGPQIEISKDFFTIIRWTVNNPGGSPVHYGVVHFGTDPKDLSQAAKNPIRLNPSHSSTVFRVYLANLKTQTTYYYTVESIGSDGKTDGVTSPIKSFTTPAPAPPAPQS